ncbi:uridine kinase [Paramicrobacterium humi]|uniref:Uridine kinase n=1 Tax=Paramicrobacterium humi TaxID=640635 RepID=A0A1H4PJV5_9MICO|nr:uridine kinase [Microbacterium humi]SEC07504.1 uridine kinase [Microbacterium humi]
MRLTSTARVEALRELRDEFLHNYPVGRTIIGVDGASGTGTSRFADGLAAVFGEIDHAAFRASMDDFHFPRARRYRLGRDSAEGYYRDSFDEGLLRRVLVEPFRLGGSTGFQLAGFDDERDQAVEARWTTAPRDAVLIVDGPFLLRPELRGIWNWSIHLDAPPAESYRRLAESIGADPDPRAGSNARYVGGQALYRRDAAPRQIAHVLVDNADEDQPRRVFADSC